MKKYKIRSTRMWIFFPTLIAFTFGFVFSISSIFDDSHSFLNFAAFLLAIIISVTLSIFVSTNKISIDLSDTRIKIDKVKGILPYKSQDIQLSEILEYSYLPDRQYAVFKLTLKSHKYIRFVEFYSVFSSKQEELQRFANKFSSLVDLLNDEKKTEIYRVLNYYETKDGRYIAYIFGFSILLLLILNTIFPTNEITQPSLWVTISAGGFYVFQVLMNKKKKK